VEPRKPDAQEMLASSSGAWRAVSMVQVLHDHFPRARWYFFVDDDTYIYTPTLLTRVLGTRDAASSHYVGWAYNVGPTLHGLLPGEWRPRVAIGGAGFGISAGLMASLAPQVPRCRTSYSWDWPGDFRIAQCIADLGYEVEDDPHLNAEGPDLALPPKMLVDGAFPPVSFHHLNQRQMYRLFKAEVVHSDDGRRIADFSRFALAELSLHEPGLGLDFKVRFGFDVTVSTANSLGAPNSNKTTSNASSVGAATVHVDELQSFRASPGGHAFQQEFRGGSCHADHSQPLSVRIDLRCNNPCSGPHRLLSACGVQATGKCGFSLVLSTELCPSFEPVTHDASTAF